MTTAIVGKLDHYINDEAGATAIEYCVIACVIGIALLPSSNGLQAAIMGKFTEINTWFK
jgi:pilus assembly protein Flp/PilA